LQTVKTGREFLSRRGAPLSSARWGLQRFSGELCRLKQWHFLNILVRPRLNSSLADWDVAGFDTPSKPGQMIVHGRNGRVSTGPEVTYMINQIRQAIWDCQHGNVQAVRERVALVTERLNPRS
jgi:hypothetical protein